MNRFSRRGISHISAIILALFCCVIDISAAEFQTKIVLFPYRRAVIPSLVDSVVNKYNVKEGETFKKDDIIALLDDRTYRQMLNKAISTEKESKANSLFAEKYYKSTLDLFKKGFQGEEQVNKAKLDYEIAKSKLDSAKAQRALIQLQLSACSIKAPFNGRLIKKTIQEHEFVRSGQPFMSIIDDNQLLAVMHLPSDTKNVIKIGDQVKIKVDETKTKHTGSVYEISGEIDPGSRTFEIKAVINNKSGKLTAGMSGVLIPTKTKK